jgi:hypothetical protein
MTYGEAIEHVEDINTRHGLTMTAVIVRTLSAHIDPVNPLIAYPYGDNGFDVEITILD